MLFWTVATLLALAVSSLVALALLRPRAGAEPTAAYDLRVYRDQLREIDRDVARGVIAGADAERVRAEVGRRILAADARMSDAPRAAGRRPGPTAALALALAAALTGGGLMLYRALGVPGYADLPRAARIAAAEHVRTTRPDQQAAEAQMAARAPVPDAAPPDPRFADLMVQLRRTVAERPDDLRGHVLLAQNEAALGNFAAARAAQAEVIRLRGEDARGQDFADLAEMMILAAGGYVSPEAEAALARALQADPANGVARYYWGLMAAQIGRPDQGFAIWDRLLRESPPDAAWVAPVEAQIGDLARLAGTDWQPPARAAALPGPDRAAVDAAADMTEAERAEMIAGMVAGLETRLLADGGSPEEWSRLIGALGVLGETDRARAAAQAARAALAGDPAGLARIAGAAAQAGVAE